MNKQSDEQESFSKGKKEESFRKGESPHGQRDSNSTSATQSSGKRKHKDNNSGSTNAG